VRHSNLTKVIQIAIGFEQLIEEKTKDQSFSKQ
jgi:hypothetical protein